MIGVIWLVGKDILILAVHVLLAMFCETWQMGCWWGNFNFNLSFLSNPGSSNLTRADGQLVDSFLIITSLCSLVNLKIFHIFLYIVNLLCCLVLSDVTTLMGSTVPFLTVVALFRYIQSTCATSGEEGLYEGLDWRSSNIASKA